MKVRSQKTEFLVVVILTCLMVFSPISLLAHAASLSPPSNQYTVSYTFQPPSVSRTSVGGESFSVLTTPTATLSGNPGEPDLPIYSSHILIPYQEDVLTVSITPGTETMLGAFDILPVDQAHPLLPGHENDSPTAEKDASIYSADQDFPGSFFTTTGTYFFRGYQILVLELHPVQYNPITQKTVFYEDFQVTVTTEQSSAPSPLYRGGIDEQVAREMIDNPAVLDTYPHTEYSPVPQYELLILTTNALKDSFIPLKDAHDAHGVPTVIKTLFDVGGSTTDDIRTIFGLPMKTGGSTTSSLAETMMWSLHRTCTPR
jgi:hypothetical protein